MSDTAQFRSAVNGFNRNDVMKYIQTLMEEKCAAQKTNDELVEKIRQLEKEIEQRKAELQASLTRCDNCEIRRENEVKLGTAMLDARRFAELLIRESEDKTYEMYTSVIRNTDEQKEKAALMEEKLQTAAAEFSACFSDLCRKTAEVEKQLGEFSKEATLKCDDFTNHRSFDSFAPEKKEKGKHNGRI